MTLPIELKDFNFKLDNELIATHPASQRDKSRLMIIDRHSGKIEIVTQFSDIIHFLNSGDLLIFNHTKVSKKRVYLQDSKGRTFETVFLESEKNGTQWHCLIKNARKLTDGDTLLSTTDHYQFHFFRNGDVTTLVSKITITESDFEKIGTIPIPPYFKRKAIKEDETRYQTIMARQPGSVAAPTAGLHFTNELLEKLEKKGIASCSLNLEIGYGTFSPISEEQWEKKKLHREFWDIDQKTAALITKQKVDGQRLISVGTTTLRVLETIYNHKDQTFSGGQGSTDLFIRPGDKIETADALITNFHLPGSSLLLLVAAFAGKDLILEAYHQAIKEKMRFYSYGDSMLII